MTTHITTAKQAVNYYMQSVPSEAFRLQILINDWGDWQEAARQVRSRLGAPFTFGDARDGTHSATLEAIADELERRAKAYGVKVPKMTLQEFLSAPQVRALLDEYNGLLRAGRDDEESARNLHRSLCATESARIGDPAPSVASGVMPALARREAARNRRLAELTDQINALARRFDRLPYLRFEWHGGADE